MSRSFGRTIVTAVACGLIGAALSAGAISLYAFPLSESNQQIEVAHVRYACGDCYVQNRILKASGSDGSLTTQRSTESENTSPSRYIGWDVIVRFNGDSDAISRFLDRHYDTSGDCIEPTFKLKGQLKRKLIYALLYRGDKYDGIYFDADQATAVYAASASCKQPIGEVPLQ